MKKIFHLSMYVVLLLSLVLAGCAGKTTTPVGEGEQAGGNSEDSGSGITLRVATVNNPDMKTMQKLSPAFEEKTGINVEFIVLPENELRKKVTEDVALGAGKFDIVTIGNYDAPIWAENGWLVPLNQYFEKMPQEKKEAYDLEDIFKPVKQALSYKDELYALPFYGESSMLYYNKDILAKVGAEMPLHPTWQEVADVARRVEQETDKTGIILRGMPGWGQIMAPLDSVINAFGGRWYDQNWNAQLTAPDTVEAVKFYVNLLKDAGQSGATSTGFTEALSMMASGEAAMWYDATVGAGFLNDPESSSVVGKIGYAYAPTAKKENTGWLWSWNLGIEAGSKNKEAAFKFITWATSKEYIKLVGEKEGWVVAPPGTRESTYENPKYQEAAPFAEIVKKSIKNADYETPTVDPVPYEGIQYISIPEFQGLGTEVSQQIAAAIAGQKSVEEAMQQAQELAEQVAKEGGYKD